MSQHEAEREAAEARAKDPSNVQPSELADVADLAWAVERLTQMCASAFINSRVYGLKLLKGFGYPDEAFGYAQDARALATVLQALADGESRAQAVRAEAERQHEQELLAERAAFHKQIELWQTAKAEAERERDMERSRFASYADTFGDLAYDLDRMRTSDWGHLRYRVMNTIRAAVKQFRSYAAGQPSPNGWKVRAEQAEAERDTALARASTGEPRAAQEPELEQAIRQLVGLVLRSRQNVGHEMRAAASYVKDLMRHAAIPPAPAEGKD